MGRVFSRIENWVLYCLILVVPHYYYRWRVDERVIDLRKARELAFFSFAIIICTFLQKSRWFRYLIIWCLLNWWLNFFIPNESFYGLVNIFAALVLYVGLKHLLNSSLKIDVVLRLLALSAIFQFGWLIMQMFGYDPIFYYIKCDGSAGMGLVPLVSWSGNPSILGVSFACTGFLLLQFFKIKKIPILFFVILSSLVILNKETIPILCFAMGGLFYIFNRYKITKKVILTTVLILLVAGIFLTFVEKPNLDRIPIWKQLIENLSIRPWVGTGINTFSYLYIFDKTGTPWKEAHNDYLQILFELGRIGIFLFTGFIVSRFVMFFRSARTNKQICIASCLVAYLTAGISLFPMRLHQLSFYAIVLLSCLERSYEQDSSTVNI